MRTHWISSPDILLSRLRSKTTTSMNWLAQVFTININRSNHKNDRTDKCTTALQMHDCTSNVRQLALKSNIWYPIICHHAFQLVLPTIFVPFETLNSTCQILQSWSSASTCTSSSTCIHTGPIPCCSHIKPRQRNIIRSSKNTIKI
jgi:transcriptional regulator with AAA-type ATPase domain